MRILPDSTELTLITCTRDRPVLFRLCEQWMARQTYAGTAQWIVVDDGCVPVVPTKGQTYTKRESSIEKMTLAKNMRRAIQLIRGSRILFIEDDDWYAPDYVEKMAWFLAKGFDIVGQRNARYYHLGLRRWKVCDNDGHASLSATGVSSRLRQELLRICARSIQTGDPLLDMPLWLGTHGFQKHLMSGEPPISVGIKGYPGAPQVRGFRRGHAPLGYQEADPGLKALRGWIGKDAERYLDCGLIPPLPEDPEEVAPRPAASPDPRPDAPPVRLSVIIPTRGRETLARTLTSLSFAGIRESDEVIVVADGPQPRAREICQKSTISSRPLYHETPPTRCYGHAQRNLGVQQATGTHLAFIDDDDIFLPGGLTTIRNSVRECHWRPHLFKAIYGINDGGPTLWREKKLAPGNICTIMFVIPNDKRRIAEWGPYQKDNRGGDFLFFQRTAENFGGEGSVVWRNEIVSAAISQSNGN